jgi:hypothetical protein
MINQTHTAGIKFRQPDSHLRKEDLLGVNLHGADLHAMPLALYHLIMNEQVNNRCALGVSIRAIDVFTL